KMLRRKADDAVVSAAPEHRTEVAQLRQRLLAAIDTLKTSNLGRTRGRAALYELPWYMIVGHPSAGKSCAILNSGLKFPLGGKDKASVQGIGGTRNCDWFFSTEGVLLDTAGRYTSQSEDRSEWLEFLKLLRKHRPRAPLNGILVAISLSELLQHRTEAFAHYARQIRQRINEVDGLFGFKTPVYLVVTKLDLLQGFDQFFEDFPEEERRQVWGATLSYEQGPGFDAVRAVDQHFEALFQGLAQMGTDKLASARANQKRPALFAFPLEFHGLKEALCRFVEALVERDPYHTSPLLRGFYFTSALQEHRPCVTTANRITRRFGLSCPGPHLPEKLDSRPFFLETLFRKVVFPDMFLVGRASRPGRGRLRLAGLVLGMAFLTVLAVGWTWSFVCNQKLIQEARAELGTARDLARRPGLADRMKALQVLQYRLEQLDHYRRDGHPWSLAWGLYRGADVEAVLRSEYFLGVRQVMLKPIRESLEASLEDRPAAGSVAPRRVEEVYNTLKTYLMLHRRERMEATHLVDQLPRHWRPWLETNRGPCPVADLSRMAERTIAFYVSQTGAPDLPLIENRDDLVGRARQRIKGEVALLSPLERIYGELKAQGNTRFAPVTVASILENKGLDLVGSSIFVPGSFTREGWRIYF
ncbi:MAG TPA: type VI secretion system membrane subunit TssM, partial [Holophaga sp.]|nr:type VI secretion system membrane subunit TssM [Holophaga sp.]